MEVDIPPVFINPLHVVQQSSGKCRLILDLSYLNKFVWKQSVRYEDIRTVFDLFQSGYFFFTFDLKYMLFAGWEVRIVKNCDRGLENAA